jgi:cobalt-zinc-cadmium resistance protein CzcA
LVKSLIQFGLTRSAIVVLGLLVFCAAGIAAFLRLNIEAYPNPAPVILEITAQASGLSAEEMEKYYTIPMEVGLYPTPGVVNIRSTSFYGLAFVRVTFKYGVDYYFALTQAANSIQQNIQLPGNLVPTIQQSSLIGEIYRYRLVGPPNFGLTNLRTLQDYVVTRRLMTIPGVVQVNAWGGTTKQFNVDADLQKLESYNITVPQLVAALGNANVNVGGREITIGQQSVNIRGIGLIDSGGTDDITKGNRVADIENIVLTQSAGLPIQIKDVARVSVGYVPRLGIAGKDKDDDIAAAIVVMGRTQHTNDIIPKVQAEVARINSDGTLPAGVHIVPYYDRSALVGVTTHTVLHNLVFGCLLVFAIQWIFLGDLRSALRS